MIVELTVENLAIIEHAQLLLGEGLTVLTGETGAGKSLVVDAIELALGERADSTLVRTGADRTVVSLAVDLRGSSAPNEVREELGLFSSEGAHLIQREVTADGRSQSRIDGKSTPIGVVKELGKQMVDLHGQHAHQSLLDPAHHAEYLDEWIGPLAIRLRDVVGRAFLELQEARKRLEIAQKGRQDLEQRTDMLRYQIQEIESVGPKVGEMAELEAQLVRLKNAERLAEACAIALGHASEDEGSAQDRLGAAIKTLAEAERLDTGLETATGPLRTSLYQLEEAVHVLRAYADGLEADPRRLEETAARVDALRVLRRKYGSDESEVLAFYAKAKAELAGLEGDAVSEEEAAARLAECEAEFASQCKELTEARKAEAKVFADQVQSQLRELAMDKAKFSVSIKHKEPDATGADKVEFFFSANTGEHAKALAKIASGGEISRAMLAVKTVLSGLAGVPTLVFDEVDSGLGGREAAVVARKLAALAQHYQVIAITHLPQIAARASTHYRIEKEEEGGRTVTRVRLLDGDERVQEIARMLAGEEVTEPALANARELLRA